jgi:hypothetical protein
LAEGDSWHLVCAKIKEPATPKSAGGSRQEQNDEVHPVNVRSS